MRLISLTFVLFAALFAPDAKADNVVIVELYTSQGCSSCPPADALLSELVDQPHVVPLAFHVDYWDYIGWKDTFAQPEFTRRQRAYAYRLGRRSVFTPHFVVNGHAHIAGAKAMELAQAVQEADRRGAGVMLSQASNEIIVNGLSQVAGPVTLLMVDYLPRNEVAIERGENAGHTLTYSNVVTQLQALGTYSGAPVFTLPVPEARSNARRVVFAQSEETGAILAGLRLN